MSAFQRALREAKNAGYNPTARSMFLDPRFWRALGRSRKWGDEDEKRLGAHPDMWTSIWLKTWHDFIDHLAMGRGVEQFFEHLERGATKS
jgi:hypothetical protein